MAQQIIKMNSMIGRIVNGVMTLAVGGFILTAIVIAITNIVK